MNRSFLPLSMKCEKANLKNIFVCCLQNFQAELEGTCRKTFV